jgi:hypothetical protein
MPHLKLVCLGPSRQELPRTSDEVLQYWQERLGPRMQPLVLYPAVKGSGHCGGSSLPD